MEEKRIINIKESAKNILKNIQIDVSCGDTELITLLQKIEKENINNDEIDLLERTVKNIENYFETKRKMQIEVNDYEYLKKIAEILRTQKIRIEDNVICGQPVFKVLLGESGENEVYYFITRDGAKNFIETHSTMLKEKDIQIDDEDERRKSNLMQVSINKNLEFGKIIDIIKRNY
ncbi:unknown [Clostridium sp. CAG:440]|nr:unknown [Clostridium sp. CAG:440]